MKLITKTYLVLAFILYYLYKVIQANLYIAYDILTPKLKANPAFIWVPIRIQSDFGILLFSNLITMTPGTLSIEISTDKKQILIHCLYHSEDEKVIADIEEIQSKILQLTT